MFRVNVSTGKAIAKRKMRGHPVCRWIVAPSCLRSASRMNNLPKSVEACVSVRPNAPGRWDYGVGVGVGANPDSPKFTFAKKLVDM